MKISFLIRRSQFIKKLCIYVCPFCVNSPGQFIKIFRKCSYITNTETLFIFNCFLNIFGRNPLWSRIYTLNSEFYRFSIKLKRRISNFQIFSAFLFQNVPYFQHLKTFVDRWLAWLFNFITPSSENDKIIFWSTIIWTSLIVFLWSSNTAIGIETNKEFHILKIPSKLPVTNNFRWWLDAKLLQP